MKLWHVFLLFVGCLLSTPAMAATPDFPAHPATYTVPTLQVQVPMAGSSTMPNVFTLRDLAIAKAGVQGLPQAIQQAAPHFTLQQVQAAAAAVADPTPYIASYHIADEVLTPVYTLRLALQYDAIKIQQLIAALAPPNAPSPTMVPPALQNHLTLQLQGTPQHAFKLQQILAKIPQIQPRLSHFNLQVYHFDLLTPLTAQQVAQALTAAQVSVVLASPTQLNLSF